MTQRFHRGLIAQATHLIEFAAAALLLAVLCDDLRADPPWFLNGRWTGWGFLGREHLEGPQAMAGTSYNFPRSYGSSVAHDAVLVDEHPVGHCTSLSDVGGSWVWMRSPEQEKVVSAGLFNRYCIRCHGADGRGVWDMPGVPDFTNSRWQISRSDDQIARIIIEGRGAVMPAFRGAINIEEAWAIARHLRTFAPGALASKPDFSATETLPAPETAPTKAK
jgi:hypothetical protein